MDEMSFIAGNVMCPNACVHLMSHHQSASRASRIHARMPLFFLVGIPSRSNHQQVLYPGFDYNYGSDNAIHVLLNEFSTELPKELWPVDFGPFGLMWVCLNWQVGSRFLLLVGKLANRSWGWGPSICSRLKRHSSKEVSNVVGPSL